MRLLKVGARITLDGRTYEVLGLTSMSVTPTRVFLRDVETGERLDVEDRAPHVVEAMPGPGSHER